MHLWTKCLNILHQYIQVQILGTNYISAIKLHRSIHHKWITCWRIIMRLQAKLKNKSGRLIQKNSF